MSPLTMGLLALLAYKAVKGSGGLGNILGQGNSAPTGRSSSPLPGAQQSSGGLSDWLQSALGGAATGGATGSILSGGLGELMRRFQQGGHGNVAQSWISSGPNQPISPQSLEQAAGADTLDELARGTGIPRDQVAHRLSQELPGDVDNLTPQGRVPTENEFRNWQAV